LSRKLVWRCLVVAPCGAGGLETGRPLSVQLVQFCVTFPAEPCDKQRFAIIFMVFFYVLFTAAALARLGYEQPAPLGHIGVCAAVCLKALSFRQLRVSGPPAPHIRCVAGLAVTLAVTVIFFVTF
jgi:hypothetical protein